MVDFKIGDRVSGIGVGWTEGYEGTEARREGVIVGFDMYGPSRCAVLDFGWAVWCSSLRLESAPAAAEWEPRKDELVEGTIIADSCIEEDQGKMVRGRFVSAGTSEAIIYMADNRFRSVTRSSLRPVNAPAQAGSVERARESDCVCGHAGCPRCDVRPVEVPSRPNADDQKHAAWMLEQDAIHARRVRQAKAQLEAPLGGPRYPYAETSHVFSTAHWEEG